MFALTGDDGRALPLDLAGAVVFAAFLAWQAHCAQPMVRLGMIQNRSFAAVNLATFLLNFAVADIGFHLPMVAVSAWNINELQVTAAFLPVSVMIATLFAPVGRLADRIGPGPLLAVGAALVACAQAGLALTAGWGAFWTA